MSEAQLDEARVASAPDLTLQVVGAAPALHVATPTLLFRLRAEEPTGREVYMLALTSQIHIDPGLRSHDNETRELLVDLFGAPDRWAATTTSIVWAQVDVLVPSFTSTTELTVPLPCTYDLEVTATKYLSALPDGEVPLSFHFSGRLFYRADDGRMQVVLVPWSSAAFRLPVATWRRMIDLHYPGSSWIRLQDDTLRRLQLRKSERGLPTFDGAVAELLAEADAETIEELVDSLLHEGYALYPYTPGSHKNATPTPFGIVYPAGYEHGHDHLRLECLVRGEAPELEVEVRFLQASGDRHRAVERRVGLGALELPPLQGEIALEVEEVEPELRRVTLTVENRTPFAGGTRAEALEHSLISTHPLLRVRGGTFVSPLEAPSCTNVNTWPVLAAPDDSAILGAAIVLPDHPQLAPESRGSLFDGTEIEEALLLHVHALSDSEREEILTGDPAVREMVERALTSTPEDIMRLHGLMRPVDPDAQPPVPPRPREEPATEREATIDGRTFRLGDRLVLRLGDRIDTYDRMLNGRTATLERIYIDYDDRIHLGVTIDDDPGQELMRETGRFHFFFAGEVELVPGHRQEHEEAR